MGLMGREVSGIYPWLGEKIEALVEDAPQDFYKISTKSSTRFL